MISCVDNSFNDKVRVLATADYFINSSLYIVFSQNRKCLASSKSHQVGRMDCDSTLKNWSDHQLK